MVYLQFCRQTACISEGRHLGDTQKIIEAQSEIRETTFVASPKPPMNLVSESLQAALLKVKWDPPADFDAPLKYMLTINACNPDVQAKMQEDAGRETDTNIFAFKVPEIIGSGELYEVSVETVVNVGGKFYHSTPIKKVFATKPLPPEKLIVELSGDEQEFSWKRSMSPSVTKYKFKIKKDDDKATDFWVEDTESHFDVYHQNEVKFKVEFDSKNDIEYKINVYSVIEYDGDWIESESLHEKVTKAIEEKETDKEPKSMITILQTPTSKPGRKPSVKRKTSRRESESQTEEFQSKRQSNSSKK